VLDNEIESLEKAKNYQGKEFEAEKILLLKMVQAMNAD
jgi:hypothetical protein